MAGLPGLTMSALLSHRTSLALLGSLALGLAFGLLAAGPINGAQGAAILRPGSDSGVLAGVHALVSLLLGLVAAIGWRAVRGALRWPEALRRPLVWFFRLSIALSVLSAAYHLGADALALMGALHLLVAASSVCLLLAFLSERFDLRLGSAWACGLALLAGTAGAVYWWHSDGDVRVLVWLEALPALLVATGVLGQPGLFTRTADWVAMLVIYMLARLADLADAWLEGLLGLPLGHVLLHLGAAAVAAILARRAWIESTATTAAPYPAEAGAGAATKRRNTSFHTAG